LYFEHVFAVNDGVALQQFCVRRVRQHISVKHNLSRNDQYLSLSFEILLQESEIAELAKNSGDSSQKMVYLNEQLREKDR